MIRKSDGIHRRHFLKASAWSVAGLALSSARQCEALPGVPSGLKVAKVEIHPAGGATFLRVMTNEGLYGIGEVHPASGSAGTPGTVRAAIEYCAEYLVGQDPLAIERHWQHLFRRSVFRGGADVMAAIGGIDIALWDIAGKAAGLPLYRLLGGPTRDRVRVFGRIGGATPDELAQAARAKIAEGFTAVHFYPLGAFFGAMPTYHRLVGNTLANVAAVREVIGPDRELMVDVVCRLKPAEAIAIGRGLEPYRPYYFEDPIEPDNIEALAHVAASIPVPVATGERLTTVYQFQEIVNRKAAAYVRPDLALAGGITNARKIAALAEASYVELVPHNPLSSVLTAACVHFCAATHNIAIQELGGIEQGSDQVDRPVTFKDGYLELPKGPGLGIDLNLEALKRYPPRSYNRRPVTTLDGALRDY